MNDRDCFKQGRDKDCVWNPNLLQDDSFESICEPSQSYLQDGDSCSLLPESTCYFRSANGYCLWGSKSSEKKTCFHPPLMTFHTLMLKYLRQDDVMSDTMLSLPKKCSKMLYNDTCVDSSHCIWDPNYNRPSIKKRINSEISDNTTEIQSILVIGSSPPSNRYIADVQSISVRAPSYDKNIITITTLSIDDVVMNMEQNEEEIEGQASALSATFRFRMGDYASDWISFNATMEKMESTLNSLLDVADPLNVVNVFMSDCAPDSGFGRCIWKAKFMTEPDPLFPLLIDSVSINGTDYNETLNDRIVITKHERHTETLIIASPRPIHNGTFILRYTPRSCASVDLKYCITYESGKISPAQNDSQITTTLSKMVNENNMRLFDYISVKSVPSSSIQSVPGMNQTMKVRYAWSITFTSQIQEFEEAEFLLTPLWKGNGCNSCDSFYYDKVNKSQPLTIVAPSDFFSSSILTAQAPMVHGGFMLGYCHINLTLPGTFYVSHGDNFVTSSEDLMPLLQSGDVIKLAERVYTIDKIVQKFYPNGNSTIYSILYLNMPFYGLTPINATISSAPFGITGYMCQYQVSPLWTFTLFSNESSTDQSTLISWLKFNSGSSVNITQQGPSIINEYYWKISFNEPPDGVILTLKIIDNPPYLSLPPGINIDIKKMQSGISPLSGSFRLAYAGYDAETVDYLAINFDTLPAKFIECDSDKIRPEKSDKCSVMATTSTGLRKIYFTKQIPINATAEIVKESLLSLGNVVDDSFYVSREEYMVPDPSYALTNRSLFYGYKYTISFRGDSPKLLELSGDTTMFDANLPALYVIDDSKLYGNDAQVIVITERDGSGPLYKPGVDLYVEMALYSSRSPCVVNSTYRYTMIDLLNGDSESLKALDSKIYSCALSNEYDSTGVQRFRKRSECVGQIEYQTVVSPCVWRGKDSPLYVKGIGKDDTEFKPILDSLWWSDVLYDGAEGITHNANCTVSLLYLSQQLLKVYSNGGKRNVSYDETVYSNADIYFHKLSTCAQNPVFWLNSTTPIYVDIIQNVMLLTIYTFGAAYALAGLVLAYRMGKFKLSFNPDRKGVKTMCTGFAIIFLAFVFGCIIGFIVGAVPALLISLIYNSIPNKLQAPMAISLGIAQALLFLYFDLGRGSRQTEKKIREE